MNPSKKIYWQPIRALPLIASMIDGLLDEIEQQNEESPGLPVEISRAR